LIDFGIKFSPFHECVPFARIEGVVMSPASLTSEDLHRRYLVQAEWTAELREQISKRLKIDECQRLLEVGSGTGAITSSMAKHTAAMIYGVDIDFPVTSFARRHDPGTSYAVADGSQLPFGDDTFDAAYSHFLYLWVDDPAALIFEMRRVVRSGGWLLAFAEPDYGGRIDYPGSLGEVGELQRDALQAQGANPEIGRKLRSLFAGAGLMAITTGILGAEWHAELDERFTNSEWQALKSDLEGRLPTGELENLRDADREAWENQSRILFVPTFYAFGQVQES
jgi:ubiquinone/menaquinone biosynthesis C-methylase UbiE